MNEISTKLYKINFKYILKHILDKEMWKRAWTIYEYDNVRLEVRLYSIDIQYNRVVLRVQKVDSYTNCYSLFDIPLSEVHYNEKVFYQKLFSCIRSVLLEYEATYIERSLPVYTNAIERTRQARDMVKAQALLECTSQDITDKDIIKSYVSWCLETKVVDYCRETLDLLAYVVCAPQYLMLSYLYQEYCPEKAEDTIGIVKSKNTEATVEENIQLVEEALDKVDWENMEELGAVLDRENDE